MLTERTIETRDLRALKRLDTNAQTMSRSKFDRLAANIARDECLTSVPLIWQCPEQGYPEGEELILSGNHRADAAVTVDVTHSECMVIRGPMEQARRIAIQLSHNALVGESDLATLSVLYQDIDELDWRDYAGLDDRELDLMSKVDLDSLAEANLEYHTVQLAFLPAEATRARAVFDELAATADETWLAAHDQYEQALATLDSAATAHRVGNIATQLGILLDIAEQHLHELQTGWLHPTGTPINQNNHKVGWETIIGTRDSPSVDAAPIAEAINHAVADVDQEDVTREKPWMLLHRLCSDYLQQRGITLG